MSLPTRTLFGLRFHAVDVPAAMDAIAGFIASGRPHLVFCANVACLGLWRRDETMQRAYRETDLLTVDGMGLRYASVLLGSPIPGASGSDLFDAVLAEAATRGYRVFFLGARPDVVGDAVAAARRTHPGLVVAGFRDGYFTAAQEEAVVAEIRAGAPDVLLLGISSPAKERFALAHREALGVPVVLGVGGMFDIAAGRRSRAPRWVQLLCLEWCWRLAQEPRRLAGRYAAGNALFLGLLARELVRVRLRGAR